METERITLSQRERDGMRVLHEVKQGIEPREKRAGDCVDHCLVSILPDAQQQPAHLPV